MPDWTFAQIKSLKSKFKHNPRVLSYLSKIERAKLDGVRDRNHMVRMHHG